MLRATLVAISLTALAGCSSRDATTVSGVANQPPNAFGTEGTSRFQLNGAVPDSATFDLPAGVEHIGQFAWSEADDSNQYWPMLTAEAPGTYDVALSFDVAGGAIASATQPAEWRVIDGLAVDTSDFRAGGGLVRMSDLYAINSGAIATSIAIQLVDADDVPLWGTAEASKGADPGHIFYDDMTIVNWSAGRADFPSQVMDAGTGAVALTFPDGSTLDTPVYHAVRPDSVPSSWNLELVVGPAPPGVRFGAAPGDLAVFWHLDTAEGQPVLYQLASTGLSSFRGDIELPELAGVDTTCGWSLVIGDGPAHELTACVGRVCTTTSLEGALTVPEPNDCRPR